MENISAIYKLAIGITLTVAFIFTVIITLASLVGWVKFKYPAQQKVLFSVLVVELVVGGVASFKGMIGLDPKETVEKIEEPLKKETAKLSAEVQEKTEEVASVKQESNEKIARLEDVVEIKETEVAQIRANAEEQMAAIASVREENAELKEVFNQIGGAAGLAQFMEGTEDLQQKLPEKMAEIEELKAANANLQTRLSNAVAPR